MDGATAAWPVSTGTVGLMVIGDTDLATDGVGAEVVGGNGWASVTVADLLGAGFMGGTFMEDIIITGEGATVAGAVLTTTVALDLAGSKEKQEGRYTQRLDWMLYIKRTILSMHCSTCKTRKNVE